MISVIMPVYNEECFLFDSIKSILDQTYRDFELIIIDDSSRDNSSRIICSFRDKRITYLKNSQNKGVAYSLNKGLKKAKGDLIARMDADDISYPNRFETQVNFLRKNPNVGVVGSCVELVDEFGKKLNFKKYPETFKEIQRASIFRNPICHPTVLFRRALTDSYGMYDENLNGAEDYDLWLRFMQYTQFANLSKPLLKYRLLQESVSFGSMKRVEYAFAKTKFKAITQYGYPWGHSVVLFKSIISLIIPLSLRQWMYEKYFKY